MERRLVQLGLMLIGIDWCLGPVRFLAPFWIQQFPFEDFQVDRFAPLLVVGVLIGLVLLAARGPIVRILYGGRGSPIPRDMLAPCVLGLYGAYLLLFAIPHVAHAAANLLDYERMGFQARFLADLVAGFFLVALSGVEVWRTGLHDSKVEVSTGEFCRAGLVLFGVDMFIRGTMSIGFSPLGLEQPVRYAVALLVLGGALLVKRRPIAARLLTDRESQSSPTPDLRTIWGLGLALIGVWFLIVAVRWPMKEFVYLCVSESAVREFFRNEPNDNVSAIVATILAALLILRGQALAGAWSRPRGATP